LILGVAVAQGGCSHDARRGDSEIQVRWAFTPSPPAVGRAHVQLTVSDLDWTPRNGARVVVTAVRDSVTMAVDTAVGQGAGQYVIDDFVFEAAGDWVLSARVDTPDGLWAEVDHPVTVGSPGS
jgi:hypothetical protein